jgi:tRNA A-37 threonylcarbamoyl transferase component Bud32
MTPGGHRLLGQLGAGPDGVAYRALAPGTTDLVELRVLTRARELNPERWFDLTHHLRHAALLDHSGARRLCGLHLDDDPPHVVLSWDEGTPLDQVLQDPAHALPAADAVALLLRLAEVVAEAHRLGLVHGRLAAKNVLLVTGNLPRLDFTDLRVRPDDEDAPSATDSTADIAALGRLLRLLVPGAREPSSQTTSALAQELSALIPELTQSDLEQRPTAAALVTRLRSLFEAVRVTRRAATPAPEFNNEATVSPEADQTNGPLTRDQLGRFHILRLLGKGGMGVVYLGEDPADGTRVALKVLHRDMAASPAGLRRFLKEARLLSEVRTPYVANLLEVNEDDGIHYLALEYVEGGGLDELLKEKGRLPERQALAIMADVARGLAEAHTRGIVHRDIKPSNILLQQVEGVSGTAGNDLPGSTSASLAQPLPRAKLTDFGLVMSSKQSLWRSPGPGPSWAPRTTWPRNNAPARLSMPAATSTASGPPCTISWPGSLRSRPKRRWPCC